MHIYIPGQLFWRGVTSHNDHCMQYGQASYTREKNRPNQTRHLGMIGAAMLPPELRPLSATTLQLLTGEINHNIISNHISKYHIDFKYDLKND